MKEINELIGILEQYTVEMASAMFVKFLILTKDFKENDWSCLWDKVKNIQNDRAKLIAGFELLDHISEVRIYEEYLSVVHLDKSLNWDEKYFLWFQISKKLFAKANISSEKLINQQWLLYETLYQQFSSYFLDIPSIDNRNENLIFITMVSLRKWIGLMPHGNLNAMLHVLWSRIFLCWRSQHYQHMTQSGYYPIS